MPSRPCTACRRADFNSITSGSNGGYTATAGYNMVTGLGTPVADQLVPDLVAYNQSGDVNTTTPIVVSVMAGYDVAGTAGTTPWRRQMSSMA